MTLRNYFFALFALFGLPVTARPNILVILTDDHRYDAMGFLDHPFLKTANLDRLAAEGVHFKNAYVTTSLCSPSRASILTGLYAHNHRVVDNYNPVRKSLTFFPELLQKAGYQTAFIGKWHMGDSEEKQRGFDHWLSFKGQGVYVPDPAMLKAKGRFVPQATNSGFNLNGEKVPQKSYITDELTDYAEDWLAAKDDEKPFLLYVSHKGVHADFLPPDRHAFKYDKVEIPTPPTPLANPDLFTDPPMWVRTIDKRCAYEESIRIPMLMRYPKSIKPGTTVETLSLKNQEVKTCLSSRIAAPNTSTERTMARKVPHFQKTSTARPEPVESKALAGG